jgi:glycosyltransferase involved in cell wall biosynthesis
MSQPCSTDVMHFVTGGFSGATSVARQLVAEGNRQGNERHILVLRRKRQTREDQLAGLAAAQIPFYLVPGFSHLATIWALVKLIRRIKPRVFIAHGFSEHLWGRLAAVWMGVPVIIHVEHNSKERYSRFRLWLAKRLAKHTRWIVGVSEGVRNELVRLGFPAQKCTFINNGIDLNIYKALPQVDFIARKNAVIMCARFARQKDHATLIKAVALLKQRAVAVELILVGAGKKSIQQRCKKLSQQLGVADCVFFLGHVNQVPQLLAQHKIAALITHFEGMPLALVEAMAAGCAVVASRVVGVQELIVDGDTGLLVNPGDVQQLADTLQQLLADNIQAAALAQRARQYALANLGIEQMAAAYNALYR